MRDLALGDLLIAPPTVTSGAWAGTVIMLTHQHPWQGVTVNRSTDVAVSQLAPVIQHHQDDDVYWGGPVNSHTVFMLHTADWHLHNTVSINTQFRITTNQRMFQALSQGLWPGHWRVCVGQAQWAPGQLEQEIHALGQAPRNQGWLVLSQPLVSTVFEHPVSALWQHAIDQCRSQAVAQWF